MIRILILSLCLFGCASEPVKTTDPQPSEHKKYYEKVSCISVGENAGGILFNFNKEACASMFKIFEW